MKGNHRRQPFVPTVPVARNLGGACSSEVSSSARGRSSESRGMTERSASISRRRRKVSISFSRKTTFTSFTLTSSEDLCRCRDIRQGQIYMPNPAPALSTLAANMHQGSLVSAEPSRPLLRTTESLFLRTHVCGHHLQVSRTHLRCPEGQP